jgi:hypothetical protein
MSGGARNWYTNAAAGIAKLSLPGGPCDSLVGRSGKRASMGKKRRIYSRSFATLDAPSVAGLASAPASLRCLLHHPGDGRHRIGLFVAKQFVEGHGGQISIDSMVEPERRGTLVRVFLPAHTQYETPGT